MHDSFKHLIYFAWTIEIFGVVSGLLNSAYTTFGEDIPDNFIAYFPAVPMMAVAVAELGRIPLASAIYNKRLFIKSLAVFGILSLSYLAIENWSFGFERIVDLRLKPVNVASRQLSAAEADLSAFQNQRNHKENGEADKREELRKGLDRRDASISQLTDQLRQEAEVYQKNLEQIREMCRLIKGVCMVPRSQKEDVRYKEEFNRLSTALTSLRDERNELQAQIDSLVTVDAGGSAQLDSKVTAAEFSVNEKRQAFKHAVDGNQIYRLAASWYGVSTSDVTEEQFASARWFFATLSAIAVAAAGSICALVYYAPTRKPGAPSSFSVLMAKVARARRAYYARKRKQLVREVPGPERVVYRDGKEPAQIIEKEVPRFIDRIVLIPRFGIRVPTYINALIGRRKENDTSDRLDEASNVMPLTKKAN